MPGSSKVYGFLLSSNAGTAPRRVRRQRRTAAEYSAGLQPTSIIEWKQFYNERTIIYDYVSRIRKDFLEKVFKSRPKGQDQFKGSRSGISV